MALDFATSYAEIIKFNKNDDGTITVYGKATSDDLDIDQQICDNDWLSKAMPEWFKSGGNIREQHSSIAAGVAQELETKDDGYYVSAHIVDPTSIKKVEAKVLKGFSIGIKGPRVVRDNKAANGRIIDGQIVEVSLVDRPANPTCQLVLAKSVGGESTLTQVEDLIEKYNENQERDERGRFGSGGSQNYESNTPAGLIPQSRDSGTIQATKDSLQGIKDNLNNHLDTMQKVDPEGHAERADVVNQANAQLNQASGWLDRANGANTDNAAHADYASRAADHIDEAGRIMGSGPSQTIANTGQSLQSMSSRLGQYAQNVSAVKSVALQYNFTNKSDKDYETMKNALLESIVEMEKSVAGDNVKFDQASYDVARRGIAQLIISEAGEIAETDSDERDDIGTLLSALKHLFNFRDGELDEDQDAVSDMAGSIAGSMINLTADGDSKGCDCDGCAACQSDGGCDSDICKGCKKMSAKSAKIDKCLECGCHQVADSHGLSQVVVTGATPTNEVANVSTATIMTPEQNAGSMKSAEGEEVVAEEVPAEEKAEELVDAELPTTTEILDEKSVTAIIEKAVKSATDTVKAEIAEYEAASKAANEKVMVLESELVAAKSAAIASGPKRTGRIAVTDTNELLLKAAEYRLKAAATSDQILAKGYKALEKEYLEKAGTPKAE